MNKINLHIKYLLYVPFLLCLVSRVMAADENAAFEGLTLVQIYNDETLKNIAVERGESTFKTFCTACHGEEAQGDTGVPDLTNGIFLWGGALSELEYTIRYGIRSGHELQRYSEMPAYTDQNFLSADQINDLVEYTLSLGYLDADQQAADRARQDFEDICSECHDYYGTGKMEYYGAPNLTDYYWLYGESKDAIREGIANGRHGISPAFEETLDDETIKMLTIYVYDISHY